MQKKENYDMSLSDDLTEASQYTGGIFKRLGDLLILFIISIIPIVDFIALGYYARILRDNPSSKTPPKLEGYMDMFIEGLKIIVVAIIWAIIIGIIAVLVAIPFIALAALGGLLTDPLSIMTSAWILVLAPFLVIFGIIAFLLGIIAFMGIVHMVKNNSFGKAFAFREIFNMIDKIGWLRYLAFFVVLFLAGAVVSAISGAAGPVGWVISAFLSVLVGVFFSRTIGLLYDKAAGTSTPLPTTQTTTA
jgi:hypothetical protein